VIAALVVLAVTVIAAVVLAVLGYSWWILLVIGLIVFFSLLDPDQGSGCGG
jgi:hypothetical protein